jgi:hypothetical protein
MWLLPVVIGALVFKLSVWCGTDGYVSSLRAAARKLASASAGLLWYETLHISDSSSVHHQEFIHYTLSNDKPYLLA